MYTMDKYINDTLTLTNSLVIKLLDIGIQINKDLYIKYGISTPSDKRMWRYFLNLSGLPHETNNEVKIHIVEINEQRVLTKELLVVYEDTRAELLKFGTIYNALITQYPDDEQFIKGTMLPVDIDIAIESRDGTLLGYDNTYVETQELGLVRGIERHTIDYLARWHIREYTLTDELYLAALLGTMYSSIPNYIMNYRLENIYSNEAHSFHLEHFFRSHLDIWDDISILNNKTKWWLYNNLRYLIKHVGKNTTLKSIIDNIFTTNGVGIGRLALTTEDPELITDLENIGISVYVSGEASVLSEGLNPQYILDDNNIQSTETVIANQLANLSTIETDILKDRADTYAKIFDQDINKVENITQQSKIFDINTVKLFSVYGVDLMQTVIENWLYQSFEGNYDRNQYFIDPNTKLQYTLSPKQGMLYLLKILMETTGEGDIEIKTFNCYNLLNNNITADELGKGLLSRRDMDAHIETIMPHIPIDVEIVDVDSFTAYMAKVVNLYKVMWLLDSNTENLSFTGDMKTISDRINKRTTIDIVSSDDSPTTITQLLINEGIDLEVTENYDKHSTIRVLIKLFTGIEIDQYEDIVAYTKKFINIFNKLTSYTTQILTSSEDTKHLNSMYSNVSVNNLTEGYITVADAELLPLERDMTWIEGASNDYLDRLDAIPYFNRIQMLNERYGILGHMAYYVQPKEIVAYVSRPLVSVEVLKNTIPYYAPGLASDANDYNANIKESLVYNVNAVTEIIEIDI